MPKQLIATEPRKAEFQSYEERAIADDEVRVRVDYASPKHGSELPQFRDENPHLKHYFDKEWNAFLPRENFETICFKPFPLGNQWVGTVIEKGASVTDYEIGERVCGYGCIQETHIVKAVDHYYLLKMPEGMSWQNAVCFDPAQFALGGIRDAHVRIGDRVAVFGLGAIGLLAAQMAKLAGASYVAVIDPIERRRQVALAYGADEAIDPTVQDAGLQLKTSTNKVGADVVIETSANPHALQAALRGVAYGGTIAYVGWARPFQAPINFGLEAHFNNAKIVFSRACSEPNPDHPRWSWRTIEDVSWSMLASGALRCEQIIDPIVPFADSPAAYEKYVDREPDASVKLGIEVTAAR